MATSYPGTRALLRDSQKGQTRFANQIQAKASHLLLPMSETHFELSRTGDFYRIRMGQSVGDQKAGLSRHQRYRRARHKAHMCQACDTTRLERGLMAGGGCSYLPPLNRLALSSASDQL